jgi:very-short-patch-repair endonuclease
MMAKNKAKKLWHICPDCKHDIQVDMSNGINSPCSYCGGYKLCPPEIECSICFEKSYASVEYSKYLHPTKNGKIDPRTIRKSVKIKYWHICPDCKHEFNSVVGNITRNHLCPYCCHPVQFLCEPHLNCALCFEKSYASYYYSKYLHPTKNGEVEPKTITKYSSKKLWHVCPECNHDHYITPGMTSNGCRCPCVRNKTENMVKNYFSTLKDIKFTHQPRFEWCRNLGTNRYLPFDFYFPEYKTVVEIDGIQHFQQISNWGNLQDLQKRDRLKEKLALENGVRIIRLLQWEIWDDKIDWKSEIEKALKAEFKPEIVYLAKNIQVYSSSSSPSASASEKESFSDVDAD